jgi:hypothetical protein
VNCIAEENVTSAQKTLQTEISILDRRSFYFFPFFFLPPADALALESSAGVPISASACAISSVGVVSAPASTKSSSMDSVLGSE